MLHNDAQPLLKNQFSLKTILLVEDDASTAEFLTLPISSEPTYTVLLVANGKEALQILKDIVPNLILLDDHLPKIDGFAFYDHLRSIQGQEETPVVFLRTSTPLHVVKETKHCEVALLKKPFELEDIVNIIQQTFTES